MATPLPPSGGQIDLNHGDQRVVVVEVGGGLRSYSAGGRDILDGYGLGEMCRSGRGQVLSPWPNRLQHGSYEFGGRRHQLPLNEPEHRNAIHSLVRWEAWAATERDPHRVVMRQVLHPRPGYPFSLILQPDYELSDAELSGPDGARVVLWADAGYGYLMVFSGDPLPDVNRRSLAVEPMTCPPDAFRSGQDLICLEPGHSFTSTWGIDPTGGRP